MEIIAFSGAHGVGKTTTMYQYAHDFKIAYPHLNIRVLSEVARSCPLDINQSATVYSQWWIFFKYCQELIEARHKGIDILITDRAHWDIIAYTANLDRLYKRINAPRPSVIMSEIAKYWLSLYKKIFFFDAEIHNYNKNDGIRDTDILFRKKINDELKLTYNTLKMPNESIITKVSSRLTELRVCY